MDLRQLATFRAVATGLSFTRAAVELGYAQSSVSAQVQALESELGVPLFDRLGRRVTLTESGRRLLPYAERMLALAEETRGAVVGEVEPMGSVTFSAPETLCTYRLPVLLSTFRSRYPGVQLAFRPLPSADTRRAVSEGTVDVAFVLDEPVRGTGLSVERLVAETLLVLAPPCHRLARSPRVVPADLEGETVLLTEEGCTYRGLFLRALASEGVYPGAVLEFGSVEAIKQCVIAGMGVTVLPEVAVTAEVADGRLAVLRWHEGLRMATQVVWHKEKWHPPAVRVFLGVSREVLDGPERRLPEDQETPLATEGP